MLKTFASAALGGLIAVSASGSVTVYNSSQLDNPDNPGYNNSNNYQLDASVINLDDVLIPDSYNPGHDPFVVTKLTFGIMRLTNAAATDIHAYYGRVSTIPGDSAALIPASITGIGSVSLAAEPLGALTTISFGDGVQPLFSVDPNFTDQPGYGEFVLGLRFSDLTDSNGWLASTGPNKGTYNIYDYFPSDGSSQIYTLGDDDAMWVKVDGYAGLVPEPAAGGAMLLVLAGVRRRSRR